jgi:AraC-like DNA-binding protein
MKPPNPPARTRILRGASEAGSWEFADRPPLPSLRPYIHSLCGYSESAPGPVERREFPAPIFPVIVEFGPPIEVFESGSLKRSSRHPGGFAAGLDDQFTLTVHGGRQSGVQMNLTPAGARAFFRLPLSQLKSRTVCLPDLLLKEERTLAERLEGLPSWDARLDFMETLMQRRLRGPTLQSSVVDWAVSQIAKSGGQMDVESLVAKSGYSQKHLIHLFQEQVGATPKLFSRIVRFGQLMERLKSSPWTSGWSELALEHGYYDQAHLIREIKAFTGEPPGKIFPIIAASLPPILRET